MKISEALKNYRRIEIELLLSHILGEPKEFLYMNSAHELTRKQANELTRMVKRRMAGEPIAYILGYKDFAGLRFKVNKDVLIPRPESEWLVERVVQGLALPKKQAGGLRYSRRQKIRILDLGTGSGCIAISIAKSLMSRVTLDINTLQAQIAASDISVKALKVAKSNAKNNSVKIKFIHSDILQNVGMYFDVIVANLPYVPLSMLNKYVLNKKLPVDSPFAGLKFEPIFALTDGTKSFQIYRRFFEQVGGHVSPTSIILLEIDPSSRKFLTEYQKKYLPSWQIKFHRDFNKLWRYAEIKIRS